MPYVSTPNITALRQLRLPFVHACICRQVLNDQDDIHTLEVLGPSKFVSRQWIQHSCASHASSDVLRILVPSWIRIDKMSSVHDINRNSRKDQRTAPLFLFTLARRALLSGAFCMVTKWKQSASTVVSASKMMSRAR